MRCFSMQMCLSHIYLSSSLSLSSAQFAGPPFICIKSYKKWLRFFLLSLIWLLYTKCENDLQEISIHIELNCEQALL